MRVLHAIRSEEQFVCRGTYHYLVNGSPTGDVEHWILTRLPDGSEIVRADIDGRNGSGANLVAHLLRDSEGSPEWLRLRYRTAEVNAAGQYTFDVASVRAACLVEGSTQRQTVVEIAARYVLDFHAVIAHDYVWRGYPEDGEDEMRSIPVFSPDFWAEETDEILGGRALRFNVQPLPVTPCPVPAGNLAVGSHFAVTLNDGTEAEVWYDKLGIPLRWFYPEKGYDFVLASYQFGNGF